MALLSYHHCFFFALTILHYLTTPFPSVLSHSFPTPNISSIHKHEPWEALYNFTSCQPGQKYKGLSNIKNYFHHLGYIPNTPPSNNFTDDFDDTLISAIETYQKNYNLNITGKLDDTTLQHMARPRCGVPDIINNTNTNNNNTHFHTVSHYTFFNGSPRWPAGTQQLTYAFWSVNNLDSNYRAAFARAFNRWTPVVKISFQETASFDTANIKIAFVGENHNDGVPFNRNLAHAFAPTDGRFHLNTYYYWVASGDVTQSNSNLAFDLESVAVHEIGHLLGLYHSNDPKAIMYPSIPARTRKVDLTQDDIQGIRALYRI